MTYKKHEISIFIDKENSHEAGDFYQIRTLWTVCFSNELI